MSLPYVAGYEQEYAALENLARWVGQLRRTGRAVMDWDLARDLRDIVDENLLDLQHLLATADGAEGERLLTDFLPMPGWEALIAAADLIMDGRHQSFSVTYRWPDQAEAGIGGRIHPDQSRVALVGPLLMLPVRAAEQWRDRARTIRPRGLYLDDED